MENKKFATAINCMDGRVQCPVKHWLQEHVGADYVDMVTESGADKIIAEGTYEQIEDIRRKVMVSVNAHESDVIAVVGHHDCVGNPVAKDEHLRLVKAGMETVRSWRLPVRILGLWANENWQVEQIAESPAFKTEGTTDEHRFDI
jgi:carbonic anhydrase